MSGLGAKRDAVDVGLLEAREPSWQPIAAMGRAHACLAPCTLDMIFRAGAARGRARSTPSALSTVPPCASTLAVPLTTSASATDTGGEGRSCAGLTRETCCALSQLQWHLKPAVLKATDSRYSTVRWPTHRTERARPHRTGSHWLARDGTTPTQNIQCTNLYDRHASAVGRCSHARNAPEWSLQPRADPRLGYQRLAEHRAGIRMALFVFGRFFSNALRKLRVMRCQPPFKVCARFSFWAQLGCKLGPVAARASVADALGVEVRAWSSGSKGRAWSSSCSESTIYSCPQTQSTTRSPYGIIPGSPFWTSPWNRERR